MFIKHFDEEQQYCCCDADKKLYEQLESRDFVSQRIDFYSIQKNRVAAFESNRNMQ